MARALDADEALTRVLGERLANVVEAVAYQTTIEAGNAGELVDRIVDGTVDMVTFTSSSTVKNFVTALGPTPPSLKDVKLACIGPTTAKTVREIIQREPDVLPNEHTIAAMVDAIKHFYRG